MRFELKAVSPEGRIESLDYQGTDEASVIQQAENHGYSVLVVRPRQAWPIPFRHSRERFPLVLFSQELLVLLQAGIPLVESVQTLAERERSKEFRALLVQVCDIVRQGNSFSSALQQFPQAFSPLYIATVQASEKTGDLAPAIGRYVAYQTQVDVVKKRLVSASIYPLLLVGVGGLVSLFLLFYVVPRFAKIYEDRSVNLPLASRLLLAWGSAVEGHAPLVVGTLVVIAAVVVYAFTRPQVRASIGDALWRVPNVGEKLKIYQLARFYRTTGMLLRGGVPMITALRMGENLLHPVLRSRLAAAARAIGEGLPVSQSMEANDLTTPVALRMLAVGERGGDMGEMMDRIAAFHDEEISRWVDWFTRLFEPLLMAFIGVLIGGIVILMYMPIFELAGNLQ